MKSTIFYHSLYITHDVLKLLTDKLHTSMKFLNIKKIFPTNIRLAVLRDQQMFLELLDLITCVNIGLLYNDCA